MQSAATPATPLQPTLQAFAFLHWITADDATGFLLLFVLLMPLPTATCNL
jgi:hypothetical protein